MYELGFIGCGNMGEAMLNRIVGTKLLSAEKIAVYDTNEDQLVTIRKIGINIVPDNQHLAQSSKYIILAVKPQMYEMVCNEIYDHLPDDSVIITMAPGVTLSRMQQLLGENRKIIRTMPNAPVTVGKGMIAICYNDLLLDEEMEYAYRLFNCFGKAEIVPENIMDAVVAVSGSAPAYVCLFVESMADAAVAEGMPRKQAYRFAEQAVYGAAAMLMETGMHPGKLKDIVCSPGGTTIESVKVLEEKGLRSSIISAMDACVKKARLLSTI